MQNKTFENHYIYKFRWFIIFALFILTVFLFLQATKVEKSYTYFSTLPEDNKIQKEFLEFRKIFKDEGHNIFIAINKNDIYNVIFFNKFRTFFNEIKKTEGVENAISIINNIILQKNDSLKCFIPKKRLDRIFNNQTDLDSNINTLKQLKIYEGLIYNNNTFLIILTIDKKIALNKSRENLILKIENLINNFKKNSDAKIYISGLPFIRTKISNLISKELGLLIIFSGIFLLLSIFIFYKNIYDVLISLIIVSVGVIWSIGTINLFGFKLTILTAIVPSLIIIIGIPNCIYFINKYHNQLANKVTKSQAIRNMIDSMGVITLFCNITMAIGFFVFIFTKSELLKEFGLIAGVNICLKFILSYFIIPLLLHYFPLYKKAKKLDLFQNKQYLIIEKAYKYLLKKSKIFIISSIILLIISIVGILNIKTNSYIIDDIPKSNKIVSDLLFFEKEFKGILSLEILINTRKKNGAINNLEFLEKIDSLSLIISQEHGLSKPLSIIDALKFVKQSYYYLDSNFYTLPNNFDIAFINSYLKSTTLNSNIKTNKLILNLIDSNKQYIRLNIKMADMGSNKLNLLINKLNLIIPKYIDTSKNDYIITGGAKTFLEGNIFIMNGLKDSIFWAIILISLCMIYLFKSIKILLISLIPNILPLLVCVGLMGLINISFQPSTVIIFSIVFGISTDITIRYLIVFRKIYNQNKNILNIEAINLLTLKETAISIIYTAIALILGFLIFIFSSFGGIKSLGWLSSLALFIGTIYNLIFLPLLLNIFYKIKIK